MAVELTIPMRRKVHQTAEKKTHQRKLIFVLWY